MTGPFSPAPAARWQRVKEVFDRALGLPHGQRTLYLNEACGTDGELREEVLSLLAASDEAGTFMDYAVLDLGGGTGSSIGRQIGPYRLESLLGQGGMGEVYLSTREVDGYSRKVALKLIRRSSVTPGALRRFRMERQILARLNHPNITHLLDGGITDDGVPYLVTEFIEGTPLDQFIVAERPSLNRRLEIFLAICEAVGFAHRNLVVHGDLKPGNILIAKDGGVKLLDFGISRLLQTGDDTTEERPGMTTVPAMTPAWASPEQLRGEPAAIASDVYSLGRLLYYLLTLEPVHRLERLGPMQFYEKLQNEPIESPSRRCGDRRLMGDLDNIVCKSLEFDASDRYLSVEALAEDIRAHITLRPISARQHTWTYRANKFIRRNRAMVLASAAVLAAIGIGLGMTLWQARIAHINYERAQRRFEDVRKLANSFIFDTDDALVKLPGSTAVRGAMLRNALEYLDGLATEAKDDPSLQEELAHAYEKIGDIQGRPGALNLGGTAASLQSYKKAEGIRRALLEGELTQQQRDVREEALANTLMRISSIFRATGDLQFALDYDRKALTMRRALLDREPKNVSRVRAVASSLTATSASLSLVGGFQGVLELRREGLEMYKRLARENPGNESDVQGLALAHTRMASILLHEQDLQGALINYKEALRIQQSLLSSHPGQAQHEMNLALAHSNLGTSYRSLGDAKAAIKEFREAAATYERYVLADPDEVRARTLLATARYREARAWIDLGHSPQALQMLRGVLEERLLLAERNPANAGARGEVAEAHAALGDAAFAGSDYKGARESYQRSVAIFSQLRMEGRFNAANREELRRVEGQLAELSKRDR